ncbi:MAG: T9SS type A sorting domain-containing protein [Crocinitomicaceae bacterium]|nr:T9SS type A sorting domain-containing protein [Crocinitomicaceae bacterium]MBK8926684.1 T9SS type A sorting domain-containing protein [Crocinitomicaceae bacterium]
MKGKVYKYSIFFYLYVFGTMGFGQQIDSIRYSPLFPDLNDQIEVVVFMRYSNYGCIKDSSHLVDMIGNQYLGSSYTCCIPGIDAIHYDTDTFQLNPNMMIPGYVDFYYMCGYKITSDCPAFPILVSGDTIPYPSDLAWISIPVGYQLGIENTEIDLLQVYPNPVQNEINFSFGQIENAEIFIYSLDGKEILHQTILDENSIDVSGLSSGNYFIKVICERGVFSAQFVKE